MFLVWLFAAMAAQGGRMFYLAALLLLLFFIAIGLCLLNDKRRARRAAAHEAAVEARLSTRHSLGKNNVDIPTFFDDFLTLHTTIIAVAVVTALREERK